MAGLARDLRSEPDAAGAMHHLVQATVDLVPGCDAAGITVARRGGRIETPAASNDWPVQGDKLQAELGEGRGGRWSEHRPVAEAICWRFRTGPPRRDLPADFPSWQRVWWWRFDRWANACDGCLELEAPPRTSLTS